VSLCVRRAEFSDPATGEADPAKAGVCSGQLCDAKVGDTFKVAGPVGKTMLLPADPSADVIMVGTGTGVAPFRGFCHRLFMEPTPAAHTFAGTAWLFLGVPVSAGLLYPEEFEAMKRRGGGQLRVTTAISREQQNAGGGRKYVQDCLREEGVEVFNRVNAGGSIYFCGLKGMMPGILEAMESVAKEQGLSWEETLNGWKKNKQWHVEVY
jgi:ferredoxin--NADP+ reductase